MDISKANFGASVQEICALIERSSFAAIDLEMTGISSPTLPETPMCSPEQAYLAKRDAAKRYNIIQVGLCLFEEADSSSSHNNNKNSLDDSTAQLDQASSDAAAAHEEPYSFIKGKKKSSSSQQQHQQLSQQSSVTTPLRLVARPFNFFVFPSGAPGGSADLSNLFPARDVTISADAASFLRAHKMDWSRWIDTGISYCNRIEMIAARDKMWQRRDEERAAAPRIANETRALLTEEQRVWLDGAVVQAAAFADEARSSNKPPGAECVLPPIRNTQACVALRAAVNADPALASTLLVSFRGRRGQHDCLLVRRALSPEEETSKMVLDAVGFSTVFQSLLAQRRPIVGHNCFADWCFMMEAFFEPLPPSLPQFKSMMRTAAPCVYDTKVLANGGCYSCPDEQNIIPASMFEATHLEGLFRAFGGLRGGATGPNSSTLGAGGGRGDSMSSSSGKNISNSKGSNSSSSSNSNNNAPQSLLEVSLPLGFTNYDGSAGKGTAAHEAGFDALMTGAVFGHFLTRYASTPLLDSAENKLALFRSMYSVDLSNSGPEPKSQQLAGSSDSSSSSSSFKDVFLPGRHQIVHIAHGMGGNAAPVENALKTAVENLSYFFNLGDGEVLCCFGSGPTEDKGDLTAPAAAASGDQRPKAVTVAQLNERIAALDQLQQKKFSDAAALTTLKKTTRTHVLPPHLQWPGMADEEDDDGYGEAKNKNNKNKLPLQAVPAGARGFVPPPRAFDPQQFRNRDWKTLMRTVVRRRK